MKGQIISQSVTRTPHPEKLLAVVLPVRRVPACITSSHVQGKKTPLTGEENASVSPVQARNRISRWVLNRISRCRANRIRKKESFKRDSKASRTGTSKPLRSEPDRSTP